MTDKPTNQDSPEYLKFRAAMLKQIRIAIGRLQKFVDSDFDFGLIRESLLLVDKVHLLNHEVFGQVSSLHHLSKLKVGRGFCADPDCFNQLLPQQQRAEHNYEMKGYLEDHCLTCAEGLARDEEYEAEDNDFD